MPAEIVLPRSITGTRTPTAAPPGHEDVQSIFDALSVADKELHWIEGTDRRFDGYNYFGAHPEIPIDWFNKHLK
ncbi:MAG: hypothetical protein ACRDRX_12520 [Pseudonocardiaceae bacterium]